MKKRWRKSWEEKWRDEASDLLGFEARALRSLLGDVAELVDGSDVGWALDSQGRPYTRARLARLLAATEGQVDLAVEQLLSAGLLIDDARGLGLLDWRRTQEDPSAERQRRRRGHERDEEVMLPVTPGVTVTRSVTPPSPPEDRGQRTEDRGDHDDAPARGCAWRPDGSPTSIAERLFVARTEGAAPLALPQAEQRTGLPRAVIRALESVGSPTRGELRTLATAYADPGLLDLRGIDDDDPSLASTVLALLHEKRCRLGITGSSGVLDGETVRTIFRPPVPEDMARETAWRLVIARAAEEMRRNEEQMRPGRRDREFFTLPALGAPKRWQYLMGAADLDRRLDATLRQRGSPGRGGLRGPPPPKNDDDLPPAIDDRSE